MSKTMDALMYNEASKYALYDFGSTPNPVGLNNTGVICWYNSFIQMMLSLPSVNRLITKIKIADKDGLPADYKNLVDKALRGENINDAKAAVLKRFTEQLLAETGINLGRGQQCVHEAMTNFINLFKSPAFENLFLTVYEYITTCPNCNRICSKIRDRGYCVFMHTEYQMKTEKDFHDYILAHPSSTDSYICDKCRVKSQNLTRVEKLRMLSEVLIVVFNKYQMKESRWYPQELTFTASNAAPDLKYKLVAKVEHGGNNQGGHYWTCALRNDKWYRMDDSSVIEGKEHCDVSTHTFMVVYHMVSG